MTRRVVVTRALPPAVLAPLEDAAVLPHPSPGDLAAALAGAAGLVCMLTDRVDDALLDAAGPGLRVVANVAVGVDNVDVAACARHGVAVTNTPGVLVDATADLALALLLAATRRVAEGDRLVRSGRDWSWDLGFMLGTGLRGKRLGIVGMGRIGAAVATRAAAFGMSVVHHSPGGGPRHGVPAVPFAELLATSDAISLHCPLTEATRHLIDAAALAAMKPTACLVNTARGPVVDEAALAAALRSGTIACAGLDVFEHEPAVHPDLLGLDRVVLLPHLGSATVETRTAMAELAVANVAAVLAGRPPLTPVHPPG